MPLAVIRPDDWNLPLLLHVGGAMVLVGSLVVVAAALLRAARADGGDDAALTRLGQRTLLFAALPGYVVMRVAAQWVASEEDVDEDAAWLGIGYATSELGLLLMIAIAITASLALRKGRASRAAAWLAVASIVIYTVTIWAMTAKPT